MIQILFFLLSIYTDESGYKYFNEYQYEKYQQNVEEFREENEGVDLGGIVFIGNSITRGFNLIRYFPGIYIYNRGIVGDVIGIGDFAGVRTRLKESCFALKPTVVFIMIGINDVGSWSARSIASSYEEIVVEIFDSLPMVELYIQSLLPTRDNYSKLNNSVDSINIYLQEMVDNISVEYFIRYIDLNTEFKNESNVLKENYSYDGVHLSTEGFNKWAEFITPLVSPNSYLFWDIEKK